MKLVMQGTYFTSQHPTHTYKPRIAHKTKPSAQPQLYLHVHVHV